MFCSLLGSSSSATGASDIIDNFGVILSNELSDVRNLFTLRRCFCIEALSASLRILRYISRTVPTLLIGIRFGTFGVGAMLALVP